MAAAKRLPLLVAVTAYAFTACVARPLPTVVVEIPTSRATLPAPTSTVARTAESVTASSTFTPQATGTAWLTPTVPPPSPAGTSVQPSPTATPAGRLGPESFPPGINPLTGLPADPQALAALPINVKVSNAPPCVRPQEGLAQADVIFEHYVEAWMTRFTAIFHSHYPARVGSVRSARLLDMELPAIFGAGFLFSGASGGVQMRIDESDFIERAFHALDGCPVLCRVPVESIQCNERTHTLFANTQTALQFFAERGFSGPQLPLTGWAFSPQPPGEGLPAVRVDIDYVNAPVRWTYDANAGLYARAQSGRSHVDPQTGLTLTAANVAVLFAHHVYTDIVESPSWYSLEIQFWDRGPGLIFRDGQAFEVTWLREQRSGLFSLVDAAGLPLPLRPGQTWFQMAGLGSTRAQTGGLWTIDPEELPLNPPPRRP
jgi:hypothetical protein